MSLTHTTSTPHLSRLTRCCSPSREALCSFDGKRFDGYGAVFFFKVPFSPLHLATLLVHCPPGRGGGPRFQILHPFWPPVPDSRWWVGARGVYHRSMLPRKHMPLSITTAAIAVCCLIDGHPHLCRFPSSPSIPTQAAPIATRDVLTSTQGRMFYLKRSELHNPGPVCNSPGSVKSAI